MDMVLLTAFGLTRNDNYKVRIEIFMSVHLKVFLVGEPLHSTENFRAGFRGQKKIFLIQGEQY